MTDTTSGALPGLRAGSPAVRPAGPGTGFSTRNLLGATAAPRTDPWSGDRKKQAVQIIKPLR